MKSVTHRTFVVLSAVSALAVGSGCARTATFAVTRPAMLNAAAVGNTMSVGGVAAPSGMPQDLQAAAEIVGDLSGRISHSLNPSIRLLAAGGGVVITGAVLGNQYAENVEQNPGTCTRSVSVYENGRQTYRSENYACTNLRRVGTASARLQFQVTHGTDNQVLFDRTYEDSVTQSTTGVYSPYERRDPAPLDGMGMLHGLRANLTDHFARVILPWQEQVTVEFEDCDGDARCRQGYDLVRAHNLAGAEPLFTQAIGEFQNATLPVPPNQAERVGEAFYNRGLLRSYLGQYARAVADLTRAIALRPDESDWQQELQAAQRMSQDQEALRQQGAVANETQNVQQAGTP